jgi:hypothetical protein
VLVKRDLRCLFCSCSLHLLVWRWTLEKNSLERWEVVNYPPTTLLGSQRFSCWQAGYERSLGSRAVGELKRRRGGRGGKINRGTEKKERGRFRREGKGEIYMTRTAKPDVQREAGGVSAAELLFQQ